MPAPVEDAVEAFWSEIPFQLFDSRFHGILEVQTSNEAEILDCLDVGRMFPELDHAGSFLLEDCFEYDIVLHEGELSQAGFIQKFFYVCLILYQFDFRLHARFWFWREHVSDYVFDGNPSVQPFVFEDMDKSYTVFFAVFSFRQIIFKLIN